MASKTIPFTITLKAPTKLSKGDIIGERYSITSISKVEFISTRVVRMTGRCKSIGWNLSKEHIKELKGDVSEES